MTRPFPPEFETRMRAQLGEEFAPFQEAHSSPPPVTIRINPAKRKLPSGNLVPWCHFGEYLPERPVFTLDPFLHAGCYYVQEASSMFIEQALKQSTDLSASLRVLDLCAAPGGKSTHLLSLISDRSLLVSNEVIRSRASVLSENIQKWGNANVVVTSNDPGDFGSLSGYFDVIVLDAPCSGEGLFRKDPNAIGEWSEHNASLCSERQRRIIADVWPALKTGGVLIYCTCTYNPSENEKNLAPLIAEGRAVSLKLQTEFPVVEEERYGVRGYHFYPNKIKGEGFFCSVLKKMEDTPVVRARTKPAFQSLSGKTAERIRPWLNHVAAFEFIIHDGLILMMAGDFRSEIEFLSRVLHTVTRGIAVATQKHDKLIPEHSLAMAPALNTSSFPVIDVDLSTALSYLRKENIVLNDERKGFALITYRNTPLGWVNLLGNRANNLYPSGWRIRMGS